MMNAGYETDLEFLLTDSFALGIEALLELFIPSVCTFGAATFRKGRVFMESYKAFGIKATAESPTPEAVQSTLQGERQNNKFSAINLSST